MEMGRLEDLLRHIPLFSSLSDRERRQVARLGRSCLIPRGNQIYLPGDPAEAVYIIAKGRVKLSRLTESGQELILAIVGAPGLFGELALIDEAPREEMAEALEDSSLYTFAAEDLTPLLNQSPTFALEVARQMGRRLKALEVRAGLLALCKVPVRLAHLLLQFMEDCGRPSAAGILLALPMAHLHLAQQIGSSRETVTAVLNHFKRQGLIDIRPMHVIIRDPDRLADLAARKGEERDREVMARLGRGSSRDHPSHPDRRGRVCRDRGYDPSPAG